MAKIVETDNYNGDYPDEKFAYPHPMPENDAETVARIFNAWSGRQAPRYWKVVDDDYRFVPGFEP